MAKFETFDKLKEHLNKLHDDGMKWRDMPKLPEFHGISYGTLWDVAHGKEPKNPILRDQLGLPPQETCGQCWRFNKYIKVARKHRIRSLADMSRASLLYAIENRTEF